MLPSGRSRSVAALACAVVIALLSAPGASASVSMHPCFMGSRLLCGSVIVPLDRTRAVPGTIRLHVERLRAARPSQPPLFFFSGGPGQAGADATEGLASLLAPVLRHRDLVVFDQRGTGLSGALDCPALERANPDRPGRAPAACAAALGSRRSLYTTADSVADLDAVRARLGYDRLALFGVSYGTKVALAYARAHPEHVDRLILDSVVPSDGPDPLLRASFRAAPRMLRELCGGACRSFTADPAADLATVVRHMRHGDLRGLVYGADGRARPASLARNRLYEVIQAGDLDPTLRAELPADLHAAARLDSAPLLRLVDRAFPHIHATPFPKLFSATLFTATICEELPFPWSPGASPAQRMEQATLRISAMPAAAFAPFDSATALSSQLLTLCHTWPGAGERFDPVARPLPDVPSLVIAGQQDVRTPIEGALAVAAQLPHARVLVVPGVGHSVVGTDTSGCAERQLIRFLQLQSTGRCSGPNRLPIAGVPPRSVSALAAITGVAGARGRAARAVLLTAQDVVAHALLSPFNAGGGLRGGSYRFSGDVLRLRRLVYIPRVVVSGTVSLLSQTADLRFTGVAGSGELRIGHGALTGTVSGHSVRGRARLLFPVGGRGGGTPLGEGPTGPWPVT